jgi:hypothetical protein
MTKAEMEFHSQSYKQQMHAVRTASNAGLYGNAVKAAISAWQHIDGMIQYSRKYEDHEEKDIEAIEVIVEFAPLLLDLRSLNELQQLLQGNRRLNSEAFRDKLAKARAQLWECHKVWAYIDQHPEIKQADLWEAADEKKIAWQSIIRAWFKMGLIGQSLVGTSHLLALKTRMGQIVSAKCSACGKTARGPKGMFLEPTTCPECGASRLFVFLASPEE